MAQRAGGRVRDPDGREKVHASELGQLAGVDGVGLRAGLPDELDLVRMGDDDTVAEGRELALQPMPVERCLECEGQRLWQRSKLPA